MIRSAPPAPFKTAILTLLIAGIVALVVASGAEARDANWKISIKIDYSSTSRTLTWRPARATSLQMYEAPDGVPAIFVVGPP